MSVEVLVSVEELLGQPDIEVEVDSSLQSLIGPEDHRKTLFKTGLSITLIAIGGISNPPIIVTTTKAHRLLSIAFSLAGFVSLAVGLVLLLLSRLLPRMPRLIWWSNILTVFGVALVKIMLGFGSSLVLMVSSSPWFMFYVIFLYMVHT